MVYSLPAKGGAVYSAGRMVAVDMLDGRAAPAADAPRLIVQGRIEKTVDNSTGANGDMMVPFLTGVFLYKNSGSAPVVQARYGQPIFIEDDITVSLDPGDNNIFAGFFRGFEADGQRVWVDTRPLPQIASFFGNNPNSNWRLSVDTGTGATVFQMWNADQATFQTVQLGGASGAENLIIAAA